MSDLDNAIADAARRLRETTNRRCGQALRRMKERIRDDFDRFDAELETLRWELYE